MPKLRTSEQIPCHYFTWRFYPRTNGVYYADGRSMALDLGRHSLGTKDRQPIANPAD